MLPSNQFNVRKESILKYRIIFFNSFLFLGFIFSIGLVINFHFGPGEYLIFFSFLFLQQMGIELGYHRLLAHRAFQTGPFFKNLLLIFALMGGQGTPHLWVANHRIHHKNSDKPGDPHSPHIFGPGLKNRIRGFCYSHFFWVIDPSNHRRPVELIPIIQDIFRDSAILKICKYQRHIFFMGLLLPTLVCGWYRQDWPGILFGLFVAGLARVFLGLQIVYSINSLGHTLGRRDFSVGDHSTNNFWLAIPSFGASWHNNHHAFPQAAHCGLKWWQIDLLGMVVITLERVGVVWNVKKLKTHLHSSKPVLS